MIVITDCDHPTIDEERAVFSAAALPFRLEHFGSEDEIIAGASDATGLLVQYARVTRRVLEALPRVRVVGRYGVGLDTIDIEAARQLGVRVVNVPDYCVEEVANHTIALALALTRGIVRLDRAVQAGIWDARTGGELRRPSRQRFGIIGLGRIGRAVASRASALGFEVVAADPAVETAGIPMVPLEMLLGTSDVVSVHCWLDRSTHHLIDAAALARMRPTAIVVNTARGPIVDEMALADALDAGAIGGAALDVTEQEPLPADSRLRGRPDVLLTPHAAFYSRESIAEMKRRVAERIVESLGADAGVRVDREPGVSSGQGR
jgi:D-3-phosphoglycerate dehydrogenase